MFVSGGNVEKVIKTSRLKQLIKSLGIKNFDYIVAVSGRGKIAASLISELSGAKLHLLYSFTGKITSPGNFAGKRLLLVDDIYRTGGTIKNAAMRFPGALIKSFAVCGPADYSIFPEPFCVKII